MNKIERGPTSDDLVEDRQTPADRKTDLPAAPPKTTGTGRWIS